VNKTDEKELCDNNTPDNTDAFQADVCSVFGEFGRYVELRCRGVSSSHWTRSEYSEWNSPNNNTSGLRIKEACRKKEKNISFVKCAELINFVIFKPPLHVLRNSAVITGGTFLTFCIIIGSSNSSDPDALLNKNVILI
jgi:hypothetical protein